MNIYLSKTLFFLHIFIALISLSAKANGNHRVDFERANSPLFGFSELNIGNDTTLCAYTPKLLNATLPNCKKCQYKWSTGDTIAKIIVKPAKTTRYAVTVTDENGIESKDDIEIKVIERPESFTVNLTPPRCTGTSDGTIIIDNITGGTSPYTIVVKGGDTVYNRLFLPKLKAGDYALSLIDKKGCKLDTLLILENPTPFNLYITPHQEVHLGDSFRLWLTPNHKLDTFFWADRHIHSLDTIIKPIDSHNYVFTGVDEFGCSKTVVSQITVRRENRYFAPNTFSPNSDNKNDFFQIYGGNTVVSIDGMNIFDQWGKHLYEATRIFPIADQVGWDGRIDGREAAIGVYMFVATITYIDGKKEIISGNFTLMR
jgi:gliding motility-associated-like protein